MYSRPKNVPGSAIIICYYIVVYFLALPDNTNDKVVGTPFIMTCNLKRGVRIILRLADHYLKKLTLYSKNLPIRKILNS